MAMRVLPMLRAAVVLSALGCAGDGGDPAAPGPSRERAALLSPAECQAAGGRVVPSPGGPASCPEGTVRIGDVSFGIEGAVCCR